MGHLPGRAHVTPAVRRSVLRPDRRKAISRAAAAGIMLALAGCSPTTTPRESDTVMDLLHQDWRLVPGVVADADGLRVTATGASIVEKDGGADRPNPPVNLAGTHLVAPDDFTLAASFTDVTADATLAVHDRPPVIADEFRIEPAGLRLTLRGETLNITVFDGTVPPVGIEPQPALEEEVTVPDPEAEISVRRSDDDLEIWSGGRTLTSVRVGEMFESGELWLELSSEDGTFTVTSLAASAPSGALLDAAGPVASDAERSPDGLQVRAALLRPGFLVGAAVAPGPLVSDADYTENLVGEFGAITPENAMKPQALSPRQGEYTFQEADALLDLAKSKEMVVHGHTIAFTEAMPRWMRSLPTGSDEEREASAAILLDYVETVVTHFRGRLDSLDVVNEPFDVDQGTGLQENVWFRVFGPTYPLVVSRAVHDADPEVRQFVNENGADVPGPRQDALRQLVLDTNEQGGYIDGVGLQAHVYDLETDAISAEDLAATLASFDDAGLEVRISENDVTDSEGEVAQAEQYATVLSGCLRSDACVSYTTWGVDDRYDWFIDEEGDLQQGNDLLFDDGEPTAAYDALRSVLED